MTRRLQIFNANVMRFFLHFKKFRMYFTFYDNKFIVIKISDIYLKQNIIIYTSVKNVAMLFWIVIICNGTLYYLYTLDRRPSRDEENNQV